MTQSQLITKTIAEVGENIGVELGTQMVKNYQVANPTDVQAYTIGRNIIDQILQQPGCVGIKFYNAINELGEKTLVYVGVDQNGNAMVEQVSVEVSGKMTTKHAIVADRARPDRWPSQETEWWESE